MTYQKATAVYGDLEEIRNLPLLTAQQEMVNPGKIYIGSQYILIGEENKGIHIFDNSNTATPTRLSFIQIPFNKEFFVKDNVIYAESLYDVMKIDINNVYDPKLMARAKDVFGTPQINNVGESLISFNYTVATDNFELNSPEAKELKRKGKIHIDYMNNMIPSSSIPSSFTSSTSDVGTLNRIAVESGHIYVLADDKLHVVENGSNEISHVRDISLGDGMETVYAQDERLYIGSESAMLTYNISNADKPSRISEFTHTTACDPVLPYGDIAYLTLRSVENAGCNVSSENTLNIIDISNINEPVSLNSIDMESPYGMTIINHFLFVGEGTNGMAIFNIKDPEKPIKLTVVQNMEAYDIMRHPTDPNIILTASSNGLEQFSIDYDQFIVTQISSVAY